MSGSSHAGNVQRVGFLAIVPGLLRRFGVEPTEVLASAGLDAAALDEPEKTVPFAAAGLLLEVASERTGCAHFGLELGKHIRTRALGQLGELMLNAPTIGDALLDFAAHQHRHAHGGVAYVLEDRDLAYFGYAVYQPDVRGYSSICDSAALAAFNLVGELAQPDRAPVLEVFFARSEPPDPAPYQEAFGVKLRFNADQTAVLLPGILLKKPVAGADPHYRKILEQRVSAYWAAGELDIATRLRRLLRTTLLTRRISEDEIALQLGMSRRTLHRRLENCGLRFRDVLEETRLEFARQLLSSTRLGIAEVGQAVGYPDPSVFTRAFSRWAGMPPREWRVK